MDFGYIWDEEKFAIVQTKHNVTFAEVLTALEDPDGFEREDPQDAQERFMIVGQSHTGRVLSVICTWTQYGRIIRIITAFEANKENTDEYQRD